MISSVIAKGIRSKLHSVVTPSLLNTTGKGISVQWVEHDDFRAKSEVSEKDYR